MPGGGRILDAGCGTGLLTFYLARRFPAASITATDIDPAMLRELARLREEHGFARERIAIGVSDLNAPAEIRLLGASAHATLSRGSLDAVVVSGALEHVALDTAMPRLVELLKPGGTFFALSMRRNPVGAALGMIYHCKPYTLPEMRSAAGRAGLDDIRVVRLGTEDFPANLSRVAILARKAADTL